MRIKNNIKSMNANRNLGINTLKQAKSLEKLSSGERINRAADDAAGLAISEKMRGQIRGLQQSVRNAQDGISFLQTAEGALDEVSNILNRMKELVVEGKNDTYSDTDKEYIDKEVGRLMLKIDSLTRNTKFNERSISESIAVAIRGNDTTEQIGVKMEDSIWTGINDPDRKTLYSPFVPAGMLHYSGTDITDPDTGFFIADSVSSIIDAETTVSAIDSAMDELNSTRAELGAQQNALESTVNNLNTTIENLQAAESRIRDTDMAGEMAKFNTQNILVNSAVSMLAQANAAPQAVLKLLG